MFPSPLPPFFCPYLKAERSVSTEETPVPKAWALGAWFQVPGQEEKVGDGCQVEGGVLGKGGQQGRIESLARTLIPGHNLFRRHWK